MNDAENPFAAPASSAIEYLKPLEANPLARRGARFAAAVIDVALLMAIFLPVNYLTGAISHPEEHQGAGEYALGLAAGFAMYLVLHGRLLATRAQTIGKYALGIHIRMLDGTRPTLAYLIGWRVLPIWLISIIPYAGVWISILDALLIFRKDRRCFHDVLAGTRVLEVPRGIEVTATAADARDHA